MIHQSRFIEVSGQSLTKVQQLNGSTLKHLSEFLIISFLNFYKFAVTKCFVFAHIIERKIPSKRDKLLVKVNKSQREK